MSRKIPVIPTIIVLAAAAYMVRLGFWQIDRLHEKEALLAHYAAAKGQPPISWPTTALNADDPLPLFRSATGNCTQPTGFRTSAGQNMLGEPGFLIIADCVKTSAGPAMAVELGWSKNPSAGRDYKGGLVSGIVAPDRISTMRLVAATPAPGLMASAPPSTDTIPNNHFSYAIQWFLFAATALIIYALVLRQRWAKEASHG